MDELERRVVADDSRHDLEVEIASQRLWLVRVEAVGEAHREDRDVGVAQREVADVGLDLDDVAHELVTRVGVEPVVFAQTGRQVEPGAVDVAR